MDKSRLEVSKESITIFWPSRIENIKFDDIIEISAYKSDLITTDLVCFEIVVEEEKCVTRQTVHEEMHGFGDVVSKLKELPGFYQKWWEAVVLPAFEQNYTLLYRRGLDLSQSDQPVRLEAASTEPWSRKKKIRLWAAVVAIIAAIVLFHETMDFIMSGHCLEGGWDEQQKSCDVRRP